jgi:hypothetical protein
LYISNKDIQLLKFLKIQIKMKSATLLISLLLISTNFIVYSQRYANCQVLPEYQQIAVVATVGEVNIKLFLKKKK